MTVPVRKAAFLAALLAAVLAGRSARAEILASYGQSYLEDVGGLRVLHLAGTPGEMGYAHGRLLAEQAKGVYQALASSFLREMTAAEQAATAAAARPYIPERFVEEVLAIAAGVNDALGEAAVSPERLLELHSWDEICRERMDRGSCAHFAALSGGTQDGHVLVAIDYADWQCVRRGVQDGAVVIVYEPDGGHTFCAVSWAGFAGVMVGMNSQGLVISEARFPALGQRDDGMPLPFQLRRVMEESADVASAEALLRSIRRTVTGNVLVADGAGESAVRALEFSKDRLEVFREGDPNEDHTYVIKARAIAATADLDGLVVNLNLPDVPGDIAAVISRPLPNAIVRSGIFAHHTGPQPLLKLQAIWAMGFVATDPDFDFLDISGLPAEYPFPSLNVTYLLDKMLAGRAREIVAVWLAGILDAIMPGWDIDLYNPSSAAPARYHALGALLEAELGGLNAASAITILGGGVTTAPFDVLRDPSSLHSVVIDATTMAMWVAAAAPLGTPGSLDANLEPYRSFDFAAFATYPLTVQTTPVTGEVFVDGVSWHQAPQSRRVKPGQYVISFGDVEGHATPPDHILTVGLDGATVTGTYEVRHELTVQIDGQGSVDPSGGAYAPGTEIRLNATPTAGWHFVAWSGDIGGSDPTTAFTINARTEVIARFAKNPPGTFSLTAHVQGKGTVAPSTGTYEDGEAVTLTATPAEGWHFLRWEQDATGTDPTVQVTFDSDKLVRAVFGQGTYQLRVTIVGQGTVEPSNGTYQAGQIVPLFATPEDGWHFTGFSGDVTGDQPSTTLTISGDMAVTVRFEPNPPGKSALTIHIEGQGTVEPGSGLYDTGDEVTLTATATLFWTFAHWTGDIESTDRTIAFKLDENKTVRAVFEPKLECVLDVKIQGLGSVILTPPGGVYPPGTAVSLEAFVQESSPVWEFLEWQGDIESDQNPVTITIEDDMAVLAVFSQKFENPACCAASAGPVAGMLMVAGLLLISRTRRGG